MGEPKQDDTRRSTGGLLQERLTTLRVLRETFEADLSEQPAEDRPADAEHE